MAQIDGITVRFSDGIKTADYAPPRLYDISANVRLADGDSVEQTLAETLSVIQRAGYAALHRPQNLKPPAQTVAEATEEAAKPARTRRTKEQIAAGVSLEDVKAAVADPSAIADEVVIPENDPNTQTTGPLEDPSAIVDVEVEDDFTVPAVEPEKGITDADLNSAVQKKNAELGNPGAIRELIGKYNRDPTKQFTLREIDQTQRRHFIHALAALTKA